MKWSTAAALVFMLACGKDSSGPAGTNFAIMNRSSDPATVILHLTDWDAVSAAWTERTDTAYLLTIQPGVCTDELLDLPAVSGQVITATDTLSLSVFSLSATNAWTVTLHVQSNSVVDRAARLRGQGCVP